MFKNLHSSYVQNNGTWYTTTSPVGPPKALYKENLLTAGAYAGGFPETPPDSESLPFYVLAMQTLLRKAEIIF